MTFYIPEPLPINLISTKTGTISSTQRYKIICNAEKIVLDFPIITILISLNNCKRTITAIAE